MKQHMRFLFTCQKIRILLCILAGFLLGIALQTATLDGIATPLLWLGNLLRTLASTGWWGNVLVWLIVLDGTLAPVVYLICRQYKAQRIATNKAPQGGALKQAGAVSCKSFKADWLLVLLSLQIFAFWFYLINPSLTPQHAHFSMQGVYLALLVWSAVVTLGSYLLLRLACSMQTLTHSQTASMLPKLLQGSAYLVLLLSSSGAVQHFLVRQGDAAGNQQAVLVFAVVSTLQWGVNLLAGMMLLWGGEVATALLQEPYEQPTITLCASRAKSCVRVLGCSILSCVACNLVQLLAFSNLNDVSITWNIPLLPLLLAGALYLLCHYVSEARAISEDNNSII